MAESLDLIKPCLEREGEERESINLNFTVS